MQDALFALAQVSIALAGFTGVVVVFGGRSGQWHALDRYRIVTILWLSLGPAFLALLPSGLEMLGIRGTALWRLSSLVFVLFATGAVIVLVRQYRLLDTESRSAQPFLMKIINRFILAPVFFAAQVFNALGIWFGPDAGAYFVGLLFLLMMAAYAFARTVLVRPRNRELDEG